MKLPLKWGLLALVGLWLLHGALDDRNARTTVLIAAMGVALWTAFSLKIPPKREPEEEPLLEPPEDEEGEAAADAEANSRESETPPPGGERGPGPH